ncbi:hypothetical protein CAEBREN_03086 [Caenorhabditis brenneri]|uniref:ribonuclease H n=1 Tax=Caenorhabditis brenneri TaxID=135651 RepID=G0P2B0_CAEBE|nr:hypothetical protein CAEBREN_03086 [Caenorhabditis brenneri]
MSRHADVYTDGACTNQGLSGARAGYGVYFGEDSQYNRSGRVVGPQDSNRGELRAAQVAIDSAKSQGLGSITIHTDSQYVRDAVHGASGFQSAGQNRDLMQSIHDSVRTTGMRVNVELVKGHSNDAGNDAAHKLATQGAKQ